MGKKGKMYTKDQLINEIGRFYNEFGRTPISKDFENLKGYPARKTFTNHFGNFNDVIRLADLEPVGISHKDIQVFYDKNYLMSLIDNYIEEHQEIPTLANMNKYCGKEVKRYYTSVFGSWNNALIGMGLQLNSISQYDDNFLEKEFHRFVLENNRIPTFRDFNSSNYPSFWCYQNRFGSWNNAVRHYGYETQEDIYSVENIKSFLRDLCDNIFESENRNFITVDDIDNFGNKYTYSTCLKNLKKHNTTVRKYLKSLGFDMPNSGHGLNYTFTDGEKVLSTYEYNFSLFLRRLGLKYQVDYFKESCYRDFTLLYRGMMRCDYVINYNKRTIYVEIAGMLRNYKNHFKNNTSIKSNKRLEKYRLTLMKKEQLLKENNLDYYILFPSDLQEDFLLSIFKKGSELIG